MVYFSSKGEKVDYGLVSQEIVTDVWKNLLPQFMDGSQTGISNFKYHAAGTGSTAPASTDTALESEVAVSRAVGAQSSSGNVYTSVGSVTFSAGPSYPLTISEHGIFDAATSGNLLDRSLLSQTRTVNQNDVITFTFNLTIS